MPLNAEKLLSFTLIVLVIALSFLQGMVYEQKLRLNDKDWKQTMLDDGERLSDRIQESQIRVYQDRVEIEGNYSWAGVEDSNSMFPVIHSGSHVIQQLVTNDTKIMTGDVVSYLLTPESEQRIIHRVISIGVDEEGEYYVLKGDNNPSPDYKKVRREQIMYVAVAIIY